MNLFFRQALQTRFAENAFSKRRRLKACQSYKKKTRKSSVFFIVTGSTLDFSANF
jgi:hypothetical protein